VTARKPDAFGDPVDRIQTRLFVPEVKVGCKAKRETDPP
jgi:hypothetical protein